MTNQWRGLQAKVINTGGIIKGGRQKEDKVVIGRFPNLIYVKYLKTYVMNEDGLVIIVLSIIIITIKVPY